MVKPKTLGKRREEWRKQWVLENIPSDQKYNPFLHKRIPRSPKLKRLEDYTYKLVRDGLDNNTINTRLQKYRNTQLCDEDINEIREDVIKWKQIEKVYEKKIEIKNEIIVLKEEFQRIFMDYMYNVQSRYLDIEKTMIKEHYHEYPEYMVLMKKKEKYLKDEEIFKSKIKKLKKNIEL